MNMKTRLRRNITEPRGGGLIPGVALFKTYGNLNE